MDLKTSGMKKIAKYKYLSSHKNIFLNGIENFGTSRYFEKFFVCVEKNMYCSFRQRKQYLVFFDYFACNTWIIIIKKYKRKSTLLNESLFESIIFVQYDTIMSLYYIQQCPSHSGQSTCPCLIIKTRQVPQTLHNSIASMTINLPLRNISIQGSQKYFLCQYLIFATNEHCSTTAYRQLK